LKINWAKSTPLSTDMVAHIRQGATRNLFVGNVEDHITEEMIRETFAPYGDFDSVAILREKKCAFVNLTSVKAALRAKEALQGRTLGDPPVQLKINFAKELATIRRPPRQSNSRSRSSTSESPRFNSDSSSSSSSASSLVSQFPPAPNAGHSDGAPHSPTDTTEVGAVEAAGPGSRAIYLGQLPVDINLRDLAQFANQYGSIEQMSYIGEKKCAFINFLDPQAALNVINLSADQPILMRGKQVRVAWAKSAALDSVLLEHIRNGATRNLFVGSVAPGVTQDHLAQVFAPFGPFESIVILRSKGIAFINLCSIKAAINARATINRDPGTFIQGMRLKVNFAKEKVGPLTGSSSTVSNNPSSMSSASGGTSMPMPTQQDVQPLQELHYQQQ